MSKRKRVGGVAATLATGLVLGLAACGSDDEPTARTKTTATKSLKGSKVTMWVMNNGPHPVEDTERILAPFEKKSGIDVDVQLVGWDVQLDRIRNAAISGAGPDITQAGTTQVPFFAALGGFEDLGDYAEQIGGSAGYADGIWKTTQVIGRDGTWAVPWFTEARAIYYRKDALAEAGIDPETAFADWDALRTTLEKLKSVSKLDGKSIKPFGAPGKKAFDLVHNVAPFIWSAGGAELTSDNTKSAIASPESQAGVQYYADLVKDGVFDTSALEKDGQGVEDMFKAGQLAVWVGGPWVLGSVKRADDKTWSDAARENLGVAPLPPGPSGKAFSFVGGSNLMVFDKSKSKDAAWEVIKFLSQDDTQTAYADLMGMFPARLEPQEQVGQSDANHEQFFAAIKQGRSYAPIPQWAGVETAYKNQLGEILDIAAGHGGKPYTPETLAKQLQKAADEADNLLAQGA